MAAADGEAGRDYRPHKSLVQVQTLYRVATVIGLEPLAGFLRS
jgi:hypothetical protein